LVVHDICGARRVWESSRRMLDVLNLEPCVESSISVTAGETGSWQGLGVVSFSDGWGGDWVRRVFQTLQLGFQDGGRCGDV
jgi:hypothetical protein